MTADVLHIAPPDNKERENGAYRTPPYNMQAEQALLGALLTNNDAVHRLPDNFAESCFYFPVHGRIYAAIKRFHDKGLVATPVTLKSFFEDDEGLKEAGGAAYLAELATLSAAIASVESYAADIYENSLKRHLIAISGDISSRAYASDMEDPAVAQIEDAERALYNIADAGSEKSFVPLSASLAEAVARAEAAHKRDSSLSGIDTGFDDLNYMLGGFQDSDLVILAGRPSMGKTALAVNLAMNGCEALSKPGEEKKSVGFFSLEMSAEQLAARMMAMESGVNSARMRAGTLEDEEFLGLVEANKRLYSMPFFIDDTPALSVSAVRARARRLKRKHNLGLLVVDYLQLLRGTAKSSEANRVQEVSEITQGLKAVAKELHIPVIALSQLSRNVENREDKRPQLSDLRESGSIEQDADIVLFIFREEYYVERTMPADHETEKYQRWQENMERCKNIAEVIIAKHRHGPVGAVRLSFDPNTTKFGPADQVPWEE